MQTSAQRKSTEDVFGEGCIPVFGSLFLTSPRDTEYERVSTEVSLYVATRISAAATQDAIDETIEDLLDDPQYMALIQRARDLMPPGKAAATATIRPAAAEQRFPFLASIIGVDVLRQIDGLILETSRLRSLTRAWTDTALSQVGGFGFPELYRAHHGSAAAALAVSTLLHIARQTVSIRKDLVLHLVNLVIQGHREFLRFFATLPGADVSFSLIAPEDRIDANTALSRHRDTTSLYRSALEKARWQAAPVYPQGVVDDCD